MNTKMIIFAIVTLVGIGGGPFLIVNRSSDVSAPMPEFDNDTYMMPGYDNNAAQNAADMSYKRCMNVMLATGQNQPEVSHEEAHRRCKVALE
jgi:hypothetical protein